MKELSAVNIVFVFKRVIVAKNPLIQILIVSRVSADLPV